MKRRWSIPLVVLLSALVRIGTAEEATYYSFRLDGKPIGFAQVEKSNITWEGQQRQQLRSKTVLKFALLGFTRTTVRRSTTLVDPQTGSPVYYELTQDVNATVTHVKCQFGQGQVETWKWAEGADQGVPAVTEFPSGAKILGSNDFGHWNLLTRSVQQAAAGQPVEFSVFVPDLGTVQKFRLVAGERKQLEANQVNYEAQAWQLQDAGITIWTDTADGRLLKMDIPGQKTTVELADPSVVQTTEKEGVREIMAQHFAQSNVTFDDYQKVRMLRAKLDVAVIGEGITNEASVLHTAMQKFEGEKVEGQIQGVVTIHSQPVAPQEAMPFPVTEPAPAELARWLNPEHLIESDDPQIVALAQELTQGMNERWAAVKKVAEWVHREIRYAIADSPSARLALEKRTGDCGPHATLTVALLRSVGIPARLVGGLVYTPSYGGSFGQHAWVEVFLGKDGWVAFDPTTGEVDVLSAVHIKMFEGMGGAIPTKIEVLEYQPTNQELAERALGPARPISWQLNHDYTYAYMKGTEKLGTEVFQIAKVTTDGRDTYQVTDKLDVTAQGTHVMSDTRFVVQDDVLPEMFHRTFDVRDTKVTRDCTFGDGKVSIRVTGPTEMEREISLKPGTYLFDNNLIASFAMLCSQFDLQEDHQIDIRTFHPTSLSVIPLTFQLKKVKTLSLGSEQVECFECNVEQIKNTFWISRDGRLVKVDIPSASIEIVLTQ